MIALGMGRLLQDLRPKGCRHMQRNWTAKIASAGDINFPDAALSVVYPLVRIWHTLSARTTAAWQVLDRKYFRLAFKSKLWGLLGGLLRMMRKRGKNVATGEEEDPDGGFMLLQP